MSSLPENLWKSRTIQSALLDEAMFENTVYGKSPKPQYWVSVPQADTLSGNIFLKNYDRNEFNIDPHQMQIEFAKDLRQILQKEAHFDGFWVIGYTHPPSTANVISVEADDCWNRMFILWFDGDGDPHIAMEVDIPFVNILQNGMAYYADMATKAWDAWNVEYNPNRVKKDMNLSDSQMTKKALSTIN